MKDTDLTDPAGRWQGYVRGTAASNASSTDRHPRSLPARFAALPLVVGAGGGNHAPEILPTLAQRPKLMAHLEALIRVDDRRWDLRLKDGSLIQLPAVDQDQALMQLEALDLRQHILDLGFERVDLRNPDAMTVRVRPVVAAAPPATPSAESPA